MKRRDESPKDALIRATVRLLRTSGLSGASLNRALDESGAPKGSLYHHFPGGKEELIITALRRFSDEFSALIESHWLAGGSFESRWQAFVSMMARGLERSDFSLGCPVAATALDLETGDKNVRRVVEEILTRWTEVLVRGLPELPEPGRRAFAGSMLATLQGALLLARALRQVEPLLSAQRFVLDAYAQARP